MAKTQQHKFGWIREKADPRDLLFVSTSHVTPPVTVDLRADCSPVYDQGQLGSCTANAVAGHLDFNRKKQGEAFIDPSRLFIYYNERKDDGDVDQDGGSTIRESVKAVKTYGAPPESEWPYDVSKFTDAPPAKAYADAIKYEDLTYLKVAQALYSMQHCLAEGYPIVVGIDVYESFESAEAAKTGIIPMPTANEALLGGHAVLVVGYKLISGSLHWIVRNSWGAQWGDQGCFYLPQQYLLDPNLSSDFWSLRKVK